MRYTRVPSTDPEVETGNQDGSKFSELSESLAAKDEILDNTESRKAKTSCWRKLLIATLWLLVFLSSAVFAGFRLENFASASYQSCSDNTAETVENDARETFFEYDHKHPEVFSTNQTACTGPKVFFYQTPKSIQL